MSTSACTALAEAAQEMLQEGSVAGGQGSTLTQKVTTIACISHAGLLLPSPALLGTRCPVLGNNVCIAAVQRLLLSYGKEALM